MEENDVVGMLDKLDKMLEQSDKMCQVSHPVIQERLKEQHNLLREVVMKFKFSVYKGIVTEARNANLLNECDALKTELTEEKQRVILLENKAKRLEETSATFTTIKEEYEELSMNLKEGVMSLQNVSERARRDLHDKNTSCHSLLGGVEKCVQTWTPECCMHLLGSDEEGEWDEPTVILTQSDLDKLDHDITALKQGLLDREKSWAKMERKDRAQRTKISRLDNELVSLREMANNRRKEIENKAITIKNLELHLKKHQREITSLKKCLMAKERTRATKKSAGKEKSIERTGSGTTTPSCTPDSTVAEASSSNPPAPKPLLARSSEGRLRPPLVSRTADNPRPLPNTARKQPKRSRSRLTRTRPTTQFGRF